MTTIPVVIDLLTPTDANYHSYGGSFNWPTCVTAHQFACHFETGMKTAASATFRVNWAMSGHAIVRLVHCDDGGGNTTEICRIDSNSKPSGISIWNAVAPWFTNQFNALVAAKKYKNLGWQVQGGPCQFYSVRLELLFND